MDERKIRRLMMERGWTRKEATRRLKVSEGTMQRILTGQRVSPRIAYRVACVFRVDVLSVAPYLSVLLEKE